MSMMRYIHFYCVAQKDDLGISSFGISLTTMEEVFMRVSTGNDSTLLLLG